MLIFLPTYKTSLLAIENNLFNYIQFDKDSF
jgi:hypothetical protein